jgi:N-acetylmuramoyl-L-alanine amidase
VVPATVFNVEYCRILNNREGHAGVRRFFLASFLALVLLSLSATLSQAAVSFGDVPSGFRAYKEISYLAEGQVVSGDNGKFYPAREVTRAEAAAMIGRAINLTGTKQATKFTDVPLQNFASGYIQSAVDQGIITGYSDGTFRPYNSVTRGEMALLINRAFGYEGKKDVYVAADVLKRMGIAQGITADNFGYEQKIKRADFSVFLARAINYKLRLYPTISYQQDYYVNQEFLNVRTGSNVYFKKIGELELGAKVQATYKVGSWTYIKTDEFEGFVNGLYLSETVVESASDTPTEPHPISTQSIVIDPGHGGKDPGASGLGIREKDVVLATGLKLKPILEQLPIEVTLTRESDVFIPLADRVAKAKAVNADIFVAIHANALNGSAHGTETYYYAAASNPYTADSKLLASKIQSRLVKAWNTYDRGIDDGNFHVLRENTMPAVLVELGFIDQVQDNAKLKSAYWQQLAAEAIYQGILDYYQAKGFDTTEFKNWDPLTAH